MSTHDEKFINLFTIVIGALIGVAIVLIFIAREIGKQNQLAWAHEDPEAVSAVDARIAPVGRVALPGDNIEDDAAAATTVAVAAPTAARKTGEQVYNEACFACHGTGVGGAPKIGDHPAWEPRIAKGKDVLHKHAIEGFQGDAGFMPPKGGRVDLSDEEISDAVDYMLAR